MPADGPVTTALSDATIGRLSKSVQAEIERLVKAANYWKGQAEIGPDRSDTFADAFSPGEGKPLGRGTRVLFHHGPGERDHVTVAVREGEVDIQAYGSYLMVLPGSSNRIRVRSIEQVDLRDLGRPR